MGDAGYKGFMEEILTDDSITKPSTYGAKLKNEGPVNSVDLLAQENAKEHHTDMYHLVRNIKTPILRRGQTFSLQITFKRPFKIEGENLRLDFYTGFESSPGKNTLIHLKITESPDLPPGKDWGVRLKSKTDTSLTLEVRSSAAAPVGVWRLIVVTQPGKQAFHGHQHFYLIFNPWCKDDAVYMENDALRKEYVLNEHGIMYNKMKDESKPEEADPQPWGYNHFSAAVLPAVIFMLEQGELPSNRRASPIDVSRMLSRRSGYVLEGKWATDNDYHGGVHPASWQTSNKIIEQYMSTKKAVKYGQCWVFGGMYNALSRAIGIPCRPVTCFGAAHDTNKNLAIDMYFGDLNDSTWNFHVWNDVWMTRPDLPDGYGGWQTVDATPQEVSTTDPKFYECGPASIHAVKKGDLAYVYETQFVYTEVNAEYIEWGKKIDGTYEILRINTTFCGRLILTKAVGEDRVDNVTRLYKYAEGTPEERQSLYLAAKQLGIEDRIKGYKIKEAGEDDVFFDLLPVKGALINTPLTMTIQVQNRTSQKTQTVDISVGAETVTYTGVKMVDLDLSEGKNPEKLYRQTLQLAPGQKEIVVVDIPPSVYVGHLADTEHVKIVARGIVKDINQVWFKMDTIAIYKPKLIVEIPAEMQVGNEFSVTLKFKNPLPMELTNCTFTISSNCFDKEVVSKFGNVKPSAEVTHQVKVTANYPGPCVILAQFNSKELPYLTGSKRGTAI